MKLRSFKEHTKLKRPWRGITVFSREQFSLGTMILQLEISSFTADPFASCNGLQLICNLEHLVSLRFQKYSESFAFFHFKFTQEYDLKQN